MTLRIVVAMLGFWLLALALSALDLARGVNTLAP